MAEFFASGRAIDFILLAMAIEAAVLAYLRLRHGTGPSLAETFVNMISGAMIMLAVRSALTDAPWTTTATFLVASFAAHLADLAIRFRRSRGP